MIYFFFLIYFHYIQAGLRTIQDIGPKLRRKLSGEIAELPEEEGCLEKEVRFIYFIYFYFIFL